MDDGEWFFGGVIFRKVDDTFATDVGEMGDVESFSFRIVCRMDCD